MAIDLNEEAAVKTETLVRENVDRYVTPSGRDGRKAVRYSRVEKQFWLNASSYNIRCALLSDASVEWRKRHITNVLNDLARAEGRDALSAKASLSSISSEGRRDIQISAPVTIQEQRELGFISETGLRPFIGQLLVEICVGPRECSSIRHLNFSSDASDETTYFSIFIDEEEMKWLRTELHRRPDAGLTVFVRARVFQEETEKHDLEPARRQRLFVEQGGITRITQTTLQIVEPEPSRERLPNEPAQADPLHLTALEAAQEFIQDENIRATPSPFSDDTWHGDGSAGPTEAPKKRHSVALYLIIALQVAIILALFFKK